MFEEWDFIFTEQNIFHISKVEVPDEGLSPNKGKCDYNVWKKRSTQKQFTFRN